MRAGEPADRAAVCGERGGGGAVRQGRQGRINPNIPNLNPIAPRAQVSLPIVRQFVASVEAAALGVKVVKGA